MDDEIERFDQPLKVLLVGGSSVGKTCILRRFVEGEFPNKCKATLGLDFKIKSMKIGQQIVKMQLWDTSGQERFRSMTQAYYRGASGIMLVYDVTEENTLTTLPDWLGDITNYAPEDVEVVLLANKSDVGEQRVVSKEAGEEFAKEHGLKFFETSAVENINITEAFTAMAELLAKKAKLKETPDNVNVTAPNGKSSYEVSQQAEKKSGCGC
ncbi:ras-related protein Rab-13-like [Amphiura filiformis]|uniref:ras-related protein Rab-13-like n=1 Tax=Amphiura filiformis TaxID=82378 RepID=UPI003B216867